MVGSSAWSTDSQVMLSPTPALCASCPSSWAAVVTTSTQADTVTPDFTSHHHATSSGRMLTNWESEHVM